MFVVLIMISVKLSIHNRFDNHASDVLAASWLRGQVYVPQDAQYQEAMVGIPLLYSQY